MNQRKTDLAIYLRTFFDCGVDRIILNLTKSFVEKDLKIDLVLNRASKSSMLKELPPEVELVDLKADGFSKYFLKLIKYLREKRPKTLFSAGHTSAEVAIIAKLLALVPTRVVVSERSNLSFETQTGNPLGNRFKSRLIPLGVRLLYPFANGIITVSNGVAQDLAMTAKLPLESIETIYNPTITPKVLKASQESLEHPWFAPGQPPVILGVGRLEPQKDFPTLIHAFAKVRQTQAAKLVILGSGGEEKKLLSLVDELDLKEDVAMLGFAKNPYVYMAKSAVLVMSSAWEGLPNVLIEAMAVGIPVVSTNCPSGPEEILDNGKYGELVPVGDSETMAQAILRVLSGDVKSINSDWLEQFKQEAVTQKYLDVLQI
ncbi:MAG: glycosyltransferase [Cyanobacteria bacterium P01_H01_bin.35]